LVATVLRKVTPVPVRRAVRAALRPGDLLRAERLRRDFVSSFLGDNRKLAQYSQEVRESGLVEHVRDRGREFQQTVAELGEQGPPSTLGAIEPREGVYLYSILRELRPRVAVETGVANGFSTAFSLLAIQRNGTGELHSIDLPREVGREYEEGAFYQGTGRTGFPPGKEPGWLIPEELRAPWRLILGRSQEELPKLLGRVGTIDTFMHDSEHSFDCMWFEFNAAWPALREGGALISDDVNSTEAFPRFAREQGRTPIKIGAGLAFLVK
jgi:predicted O-methyltransferase YrrM